MTISDPILIGLCVAVSGVVAFISVRLLIPVLAQRNIVDLPGARSSHTKVTPRGGGIGVCIGVLAGLLIASVVSDGVVASAYVVFGLGGGLALLSLLDDVRPLPPAFRFFMHALCVAAALGFGVVAVPPLFLNLFGWGVAVVGVFFAWLWFVNLYNFMDGVDGITAVETICICTGIALITWMSGGAPILVFAALIISAACVGFLFWNWHPAKIFLGDVGSIPLGFVIGWMLLELAAAGHWAAAFILPMYYLADATITLFRRALRRERVWQAHKEHFYQRAHQGGLSHAEISLRVFAINAVLVGLAISSANGYILPSFVGAVIIVGFLLFHLSRSGKTAA